MTTEKKRPLPLATKPGERAGKVKGIPMTNPITAMVHKPRHRAETQAPDSMSVPTSRLSRSDRLHLIAYSLKNEALYHRFLADHGVQAKAVAA